MVVTVARGRPAVVVTSYGPELGVESFL
jgi:hypothetical protein